MSASRPRIIPAAGNVPEVKRDALEAFRVLKAGGVVILPTEVGYGILASSAEGIERAFAAKQRVYGHTVGIIGTYRQHEELHILPQEKFDMTRVITQDYSSTLAVIARYRKDHPRLQYLSEQTMQRLTKDDTLGIALTEGPLLHELGRLNDEDGQLMMGSSANLTGRGQKFRVEDIEPEVLECADLVVDYGLQRYHRYGRAGIVVDMEDMKVLRIGAGYEVFRYRMKRWFGVDFPEDPDYRSHDDEGRSANVGVSIKPEPYDPR